MAARLPESQLFCDPNNDYIVHDENRNNYFVADVTGEFDARRMEPMFETINCQPTSRFFLHGVG